MLQTIEIVGATAGPKLLITGGVHGDEYEPMVACRKLAEMLKPEALRGAVTVVPCVNVAAFERGMRTADDGLDLARTCPGKVDGRPTERVAHALSELIRAADYYIDLHTGGVAYELFPLAGYTLHRDPQILEAQRRMARAFNLPLVWGTSPNLDGRSLSVARDAGVPAIYAEYGGGSVCSAAGTAAYVDGCLNVLAEFGMLERVPPQNGVLYVKEDPRDGSGHLQLGHPAPRTGIFEACVALGDRVTQGDRLGTVTDVTGAAATDITANASGVLIMLPGLPRVVKDQATAMIVEV
ncbi:MAG: succinylglutamate desuccinylase [Pirellula sp.]|nr:succinylglutamate desuccinylase [Pirellula sp.]